MSPRLFERYKSEIVPKLMEKCGFKNIHEVPRLSKIVINVGLGEAVQDKKLLDGVVEEVACITGQRPTVTLTKKAIAGFKIRKGLPVGCKVTLRKDRMYEFLDRLINVVLPRIRDFRGISSKSFDEAGNYSFGLQEQGVFPEINVDKIQIVHGMDISIITTAKTKEESMELLTYFGMPFNKR
ncbi:MAG: 50S ribosomal protein L5 [Candidatus Omnitrophota bacterium]